MYEKERVKPLVTIFSKAWEKVAVPREYSLLVHYSTNALTASWGKERRKTRLTYQLREMLYPSRIFKTQYDTETNVFKGVFLDCVSLRPASRRMLSLDFIAFKRLRRTMHRCNYSFILYRADGWPVDRSSPASGPTTKRHLRIVFVFKVVFVFMFIEISASFQLTPRRFIFDNVVNKPWSPASFCVLPCTLFTLGRIC